ncbi:transcription antitermination factor NusB [Natroniella sp. ANB-PHB2]|uniref:transcription antitermination factor NusB n=1 Tax=Natroniella sp. ANB-PHB2 TaxID=3384444 RepID=UPI0038D435C9
MICFGDGLKEEEIKISCNVNRHQAREIAIQVLYQMDINKEGLEENLSILSQEQPELDLSSGFLVEIIEGTVNNLEQIDRLITQNTVGWKIERMSKVDKSIIRLAVYEILHQAEIPIAVSINEAVELAKSFSDQQSSKFVNGVLGNIADSLEIREED